MRRYPHLYEINACVFLKRMSRKYGRALTLATVPDEEWQQMARLGFDLIWLMGVWQRSPGARQKALFEPTLRRAYDQILPGWWEDDVAGSPYAVYAYDLDPLLGEPGELAQLKSKLNHLGIGLVLDFVPNHLAFDHRWTVSHPDWFVQGRKGDVQAHPDRFFLSKPGIYLAHGRDPNFSPWTDTVQANFYSDDLRRALINELRRIAQVADGVRCDMTMLVLNEIFGKVWGQVLKNDRQAPTEFWAEAIPQIKQQRPGFIFLAEVYWGFEPKLQQLGFDFTYDKTFYDLLRYSDSGSIRSYLMRDEASQQRSIHFIENHDEPRAITDMGRQRSLAAAVILATLPGLRFFHDGQFEGRHIRLPVQLAREPDEVIDIEIRQFYYRLMEVSNASVFHQGEWSLVEVNETAQGNETHSKLLAWSWRYDEQLKIVIVNYSPQPAQGWLKLPLALKTPERYALRDELTDKVHPWASREVVTKGLYIDLDPWQAHILDVTSG